MSRPYIIGTTGNYHSGKNEVGDKLVEYLSSSGSPETVSVFAKGFSFAEEIKIFAVKYFGWDGNKEGDIELLLSQYFYVLVT